MAGTAPKAAVTFVVLALALGAGCSDDSPPPNGPDPTAGAAAALTVPPVPTPLDPGHFRDRPCELMSERQSDQLGLPVATQDREAGRPTCTWHAGEDSDPLDVLTIRFQSRGGLSEIAQQCQNNPECAPWTADEIDGYPVIRANGELESRYGLCRLFVGVADDVSFLVTDGDPDTVRKSAVDDGDGPRCDRADEAATFAIRTMEEGP